MMATMHRMSSQIELYEEMSQLSSRMVVAARANEWDNLIELEGAVAALRETLVADSGADATESNDASPSASLSARKRDLIQRILEDDAEVRRHTEPWMEQVRGFIGDSVRRREVQNAYAAGAGETRSGAYGA